MLQKLVVGLLAFTVVGAAGIGIYDATQHDVDGAEAQVLADSAQGDPSGVSADLPAGVADAQPANPEGPSPDAATTATPETAAVFSAAGSTGPIQEQQAVDMVGNPWSSIGTITAIETNGVALARQDGTEIFLELGPSHFWADAVLAVGDTITAYGFFNGEQYHAATVYLTDGSSLALRTDTGTPLWSGGATAGGAGQHGTDGTSTEPQVAAEDWLTLDGTVVLVDASTITMQTAAGETLLLQLGQPAFAQQQGVAFAAGDAIRVLGFWQGTTFRAGEITKLATGQRLMLLDPNGLPLWGGPGRNGQNNANSAQNQTAQNQAAQAQGVSGQGANGQGANGQGANGQAGQGQSAAVLVPATQWQTLEGSVRLTESLALTLGLADGTTVRVQLGEVDFWTADGIVFRYGDTLQVDGYWLNGEFQAGALRFVQSGMALTIRDQFGRLLWVDASAVNGTQGAGSQGSQGAGGQGANGYRGGR